MEKLHLSFYNREILITIVGITMAERAGSCASRNAGSRKRITTVAAMETGINKLMLYNTPSSSSLQRK